VLVIGVVALEFASRVLLPIAPGARFLDQQGNPVEIHDGHYAVRMTPSTTFRQVTADYDARATIGPEGYRAPLAEGPPDVIFIGDSFTFGQGLEDDQTFAALFCRQARRSCANLGHPGTGTYTQVRILEHFLATYAWRPTEVKLFMLAYASGLASGNDFVDTVYELDMAARRDAPEAAAARASPAVQRDDSWWSGVLERREWILIHSNLMRIAYVQFGAQLRAMFAGSSPPDLSAGIAAVRNELERLKALGEAYDFKTTLYVLHPVQDLTRQTYAETLAAVRSAAGSLPVVDTAPVLLDEPRRYYFPYDGHFNPAGAARVADLLAGETAR
jgi:hypothetical protein